jgi:hypothetical protein
MILKRSKLAQDFVTGGTPSACVFRRIRRP